jgi:ABC-type nitrate/sulfonate/bicarbonate transport system substrate-binding protein
MAMQMVGNKSGVFRFALLLFAVFIVSACGDNGGNQVAQKTGKLLPVTIGINSTLKSASILVAHELGYFEEAGLDVNLIIKQSAVPLIKGLSKGEMDLITVPDDMFVREVANESALKIVSVVNRSSTSEVIARKDRGITQIKDLKGKRIGITLKSGTIFWLQRLLIYNYIKIDDVELVDLRPTQIPDALANGEIDAAITWYPHAFVAAELLGENAYRQTAQPDQKLQWLLIGQKHWVEGNNDILKKTIRALLKANEFMKQNPEKTIDTIVTGFEARKDFIDREWSSHEYVVDLPQNLLLLLETAYRWETRDHQKDVPIPNFIDSIHVEALREIAPEMISIIQ